MGWLSKIFKGGSSHKISEGQYHGKHGADMIWNDPSYYSDDLSEKEREDISQAIALSISDEEQKKENGSGSSSQADLDDDEQLARALQENNGSHLEEDEQLARALQESLNTNPIPYESGRNYQPYENGHNYQPLQLPFVTSFRICAGCNREIGHGRFLSCMGAVWHPECFRCHACNLPISDYEFSMSGNHPYHKSCYKGLYHPKCDVCKQFIPTNFSGLIEYRAHPFWEQNIAPRMSLMVLPVAVVVKRMEPRDTQYISLGDGRKLCLECLDSSIMDTSECQPLYLDIQDFYEGLNMKVVQQVPLLLVERQALNEALEGEKNGNHHMPETRGLCLSEEQIVRSVRVLRKCNSEKILRKPRIGVGNIFDLITEPYRVTRQCEVTAILILFGLPRLLTGSILAHEMMHAWLRLNGFQTLSPDVEEGICQVLAHMWLDSEIMSGSGSHVASTSSSSSSSSTKKGTRSQFEKKLGDFFKHQIESDTSSAYGDGFRNGNKAVLQYGLRRTLDHIR